VAGSAEEKSRQLRISVPLCVHMVQKITNGWMLGCLLIPDPNALPLTKNKAIE